MTNQPTPQEVLRDKVSEYWKIVYQCRQHYLYCLRLHKPKDELEAKYLAVDRFMNNTRHLYWRVLIIEIAKLYSTSRNDYYNIQNFTNQFKADQIFGWVQVNHETLQEWQSFLDTNQMLLQTIRGLRNRFYGHTDTPAQKAEVEYDDLTIEQIEPLIAFAEQLLKVIYLSAFDSDVSLRVEYHEGDFDFISILAKEKQNRIKEILGPRFTIEGEP
ncbi:AbiU2 domain-containing protein [Chitinophaga arvensicola]|uniref:HEPN AbiU2-like domain-containing protein n=1 Tax=Chitinophaga arvensicola TaxID=29529 RepID=A0A1I0PRJ2_9BACT|nr:hypothetical protein [Chitinophaga arvensicola]SEW16986.1 hypothetical protein SAMN04488122_0932 [Chitinophaga arvensicola]